MWTVVRLWLLVASLLLWVVVSGQLQQQEEEEESLLCTLCRGGEEVSTPHVVPFEAPSLLAGQTCRQLEGLLTFLYPTNATTTECRLIQSIIGTSLCGCPYTFERNTCNGFCDNEYSPLFNATRELPLLQDLLVLSNSDNNMNGSETSALLDVLGITPTCGMLRSYLESTPDSADNPICFIASTFMNDYCGCSTTEGEEEEEVSTDNNNNNALPCSLCLNAQDSIAFPNKTLEMPGLPFSTCLDMENAAALLLQHESDQCSWLKDIGHFCGCPPDPRLVVDDVHGGCNLCLNGQSVQHEHRLVTFGLSSSGNALTSVVTPTCGLIEASLLGTTAEDSDTCQSARLAYGGYCGCPPLDNHCEYCPGEDGIQPAYQDKAIPFFAEYFDDGGNNDDITCQQAWYTQFQIHANDERCALARSGRHLCGCNNGQFDYLDANTHAKKAVLAWMPRLSAFFSILVRNAYPIPSIYTEIKRKKKKQWSGSCVSCRDGYCFVTVVVVVVCVCASTCSCACVFLHE